jgi:hypothetical protein
MLIKWLWSQVPVLARATMHLTPSHKKPHYDTLSFLTCLLIGYFDLYLPISRDNYYAPRGNSVKLSKLESFNFFT